MGAMELSILNSRKEAHKAIVVAVHDLEQLGYMISSIAQENGELVARFAIPPSQEAQRVLKALEQGYGIDGCGDTLSMDGVSETFKQ
jgi:hypothetical protein